MGETIKIGYFAQEEQEMDERQRVIDYVKDIAEYINTKDGKSAHLRCWNVFCLLLICSYAPIGNCPVKRKGVYILLGVLSSKLMCCF